MSGFQVNLHASASGIWKNYNEGTARTETPAVAASAFSRQASATNRRWPPPDCIPRSRYATEGGIQYKVFFILERNQVSKGHPDNQELPNMAHSKDSRPHIQGIQERCSKEIFQHWIKNAKDFKPKKQKPFRIVSNNRKFPSKSSPTNTPWCTLPLAECKSFWTRLLSPKCTKQL